MDADVSALAAGFVARRPAALEAAYECYSLELYSVARAVLRNAADAEDCVHDALLRVWRTPDSFRQERGSLRAFLIGCVRNEAMSRLRSAARRAEREKERLSVSNRCRNGSRCRSTTSKRRAFARRWRAFPRNSGRRGRKRLLRQPLAARDRREVRPSAGHGQEPRACSACANCRATFDPRPVRERAARCRPGGSLRAGIAGRQRARRGRCARCNVRCVPATHRRRPRRPSRRWLRLCRAIRAQCGA